MSTIRVTKRERWTSIANSTIEDNRLTWEARGMLVYLLSKPDNWSIKRDHLVNEAPNGQHQVKRILRELREAGYLVRKQVSDGKSIVTETWLHETPQPVDSDDVEDDSEDPAPSGRYPTRRNPTGRASTSIVSTEVVTTEEATTTTAQASPDAPDEDEPQDRLKLSLVTDKPKNAETEELFEREFWSKYPKRNGKRVGKTVTRRLWAKLNAQDRADAVKALAAYERHANGFAKDPERYLRNRVWEDFLEDDAPPKVSYGPPQFQEPAPVRYA